MTRSNPDDLARAAGFTQMQRQSFYNQERFARFAALVRAQALAEAAKVCEERYPPSAGSIYHVVAQGCAGAIRGMMK